MNPDPNLVVEALRRMGYGSAEFGWDDLPRVRADAQTVLPHAEAIAEMWVSQEAALREYEAWLSEACWALGVRDVFGFKDRHAAVQELIAAAGGIPPYEHTQAHMHRMPGLWDDTGRTCERCADFDRLRAALKNLEEEA